MPTTRTAFRLTALLLTFGIPAAGAAAPRQAGVDLVSFSRIDAAWPMSRGSGSTVAVLDWLFDLSSAAADKYVEPTSLVPGQPIGEIEAWHGEWMAEIVHRVAPEARILPIRARPSCDEQAAGPCDEQAYEKYLIEGIRFAADQGAVAVTNSMGPVAHSAALLAAVEYAEARGTLFVDVHPEYLVYTSEEYVECEPPSRDGSHGPRACSDLILHPGLVSVPGHETRPEPGRDLYVWPYQTDPVFRDGWGYSNGPPIVGGVVALVASANPDLGPAEIRAVLRRTTRVHEDFDVLDAEAAVREAIRMR